MKQPQHHLSECGNSSDIDVRDSDELASTGRYYLQSMAAATVLREQQSLLQQMPMGISSRLHCAQYQAFTP
jgi:hypothetical protein